MSCEPRINKIILHLHTEKAEAKLLNILLEKKNVHLFDYFRWQAVRPVSRFTAPC